MELEIQKWVRKVKPFMKESEELFNEAIECYKVGANKAAFIMSYLAYEKNIQSKILNFRGIPADKTEEEWKKIKENINDEYYWEKNTFNQIEQKDGVIKFSNRKYVLSKLKAYKATRDVCVHGKSETINAATVEEFWTFLKDNISKFNVNGGKEYFKEALFKSFRDRNEQLDLSYDILLESLPFADLIQDDLIDIWDYLDKNFNQLYGVKEEDIIEFWNKILLNTDENIQKSFINFTQKGCSTFIKFYKFNNSLLNLSMNISDGITFKKEVLYKWIETGQPAIYKNEIFWDFIIKILDYIPKEDTKGFFKLLTIEDIRYIPTKEQSNILKNYGFFSEMEEYLCTELQYDYDKVPDRLKYLDIVMFIAKNCLNDNIINMLANYWAKLKYYSKYPKSWDSLCIFEENLLDDKDIMNKLIEIVNENDFKFAYNLNIEKMIKRSEELENL